MRPLLEMLLVVVALATHTCGLPYRDLPPQLQTDGQSVWYGDSAVSQVQDNGYPIYQENFVPQQIGQAQFIWDQSQEDILEGYQRYVPPEVQRQDNANYVYDSAQVLLPPHNTAEDALTVSCSGQDRICVAKSLCINGYVHPLKQGFVRTGQVQECKLDHEVCCTVRYELNNLSYDNDRINTVSKDNQFHKYPEPTLENDQKYVQYGENNQADVAEISSPLESDAELQSQPHEGYTLKVPDNPLIDTKTSEGAENKPVPDYLAPAETKQEQFDDGSANDSEPSTKEDASGAAIFSIQSGCAAALLCVEEQYCTLEGVISPEPVTLTSNQLLRRVPLSSCRNSESGLIGKCCRDPNYVDPWPMGNLPANYSGGFDEQGFPTFLNIAKVRPPVKKPQPTTTFPKPTTTFPKPTTTFPKPSTTFPKSTTTFPKPTTAFLPPHEIHDQYPTSAIPLDLSTATPQIVVTIAPSTFAPTTFAPFTQTPYDSGSGIQETISVVPELPRKNTCGVRNYGQRPVGFKETDAAFAEIPWQAMVLWSPERKILCSGALVSPNAVLTAASCVNRFSSNELSVKLGEWKLGYELEREEPLPFEIVNVQTIKYHPGYVEGFSSNDTAILLLDHPATFDLHVNTLCLPDDYQAQETSQCIVTGWGKSILQAHYSGVIMHTVDVDLLSREACRNRVLGAESQIVIANDVICAKAHEANNMCQADVGGALACHNGNGAYHIAGIYSQDTGCLPTNQVATFAPIDVSWVKQIMQHPHTIETKVDAGQINIDDGYDYRKSNLPAGNEYLPPV